MKRFMLLFLFLAFASSAVAATPKPVVHLKDDAFQPATITVDVGELVTFVNDDDDAHTVTASDNSFDSKGLDTHQQWTHVFTRPGRYAYFCTLHPFMKGTIIVKAVHP
jgi:plastocyanin